MDPSHPASDPSSQPSQPSSSPSTKPLCPPPLPPHHLTDLVPHLLPPLPPLPAHLLSTPLIQRLTYLPPSPNDIDAHLSPLPSHASQPITHALNSLAHGYTMDPTEYTSDGESVFARRIVRPVGGYGGTTDIAELRWLYEDKDERGWGFYGVHLPTTEEQDFADSGRGLKWASRVPEIPSHEAPPAEDYWAGFSSSSDSPVEDDEHAPHDPQAEDDYWARYSAGAPSAQPSTRPTPSHSRRQSRLNASANANATTSDIDAGATTDIDATGPGPSLAHLDAKRLAETISAAVGQAPGTIQVDENTVKRVTEALATLHPSLASSWADPSPWQSAGSSQHAEEKLQATKGRLRMKLGSLLRAAWLTYLGNVTMDDEIEEKAMRWLRFGREVASASSSTQPIGDEGGGGGVSVGADVANMDLSEVLARTKMETLKEMWAAAEDEHPSEEFYRAVEQALKASRPEMRDRRYSAEQQSYWES